MQKPNRRGCDWTLIALLATASWDATSGAAVPPSEPAPPAALHAAAVPDKPGESEPKARAKYLLGVRRLLGQGVEKDRALGVKLVAEASDEGDRRAAVVATLARYSRALPASGPIAPLSAPPTVPEAIQSPEDAVRGEEELKGNPTDVGLRILLVNYYRASSGPTVVRGAAREAPSRADWLRHLTWLIENCPDAPFMRFWRNDGMDPQVREAWMKQIDAHPKDAAVLANAAAIVGDTDRSAGLALLRRAVDLEPNEPLWRKWLLGVHRQPFIWRATLENLAGEDRKTRLTELREAADAILAISRGTRDPAEQAERTDLKRLLAMSALELGDGESATRLAAELLRPADDEAGANGAGGKPSPLAAHYAHIVMGRLALLAGDVGKAKSELAEAGNVGPSAPSSNRMSFVLLSNQGGPVMGPQHADMTLARDLLEKGERDTVLTYIERCGPSLAMARSDLWVRLVRAGKTPYFTEGFGY